jgi:rod shape-determining protein MreC
MVNASRTRWLPLSLLVALLLAAALLGQLGYLQPIRGAARMVLAPLQTGLSRLATGAGDLLFGVRDVGDFRQRVLELQVEVNRLAVDNARLVEVERENQRLRQLLNFTRNNPWYDYRSAAVIGQRIGEDTSNLLFSIFVDVGARDGVAAGMPVVTDRGLVGRVTSVGPNVAQVLLIIDPASAVSGRIQTSRATGLVRGNIDGGVIMERIPQGENVSPGDIVLTSGLGGNFPDKLVIGQVTEVLRRDLDMFQTARIRTTVDFGKLETLLVITKFTPARLEDQLPAAGSQETTH